MSINHCLPILYVNNIPSSKSFYQEIFNCPPIEDNRAFVMFVLSSGAKLGLWHINDVGPMQNQIPQKLEIALPLKTDNLVDQYFQQCQEMNYEVLQKPTQIEFGYNVVVADPDSHRVSFYCLGDM